MIVDRRTAALTCARLLVVVVVVVVVVVYMLRINFVNLYVRLCGSRERLCNSIYTMLLMTTMTVSYTHLTLPTNREV